MPRAKFSGKNKAPVKGPAKPLQGTRAGPTASDTAQAPKVPVKAAPASQSDSGNGPTFISTWPNAFSRASHARQSNSVRQYQHSSSR